MEDMLTVNIKDGYDIVVLEGVLDSIGEHIDLNKKVLIVTDENIPYEYIIKVKNACLEPVVKVIKPGEESKSLAVFEELLSIMLENSFSRNDKVVAIGGGVVGDLSAFAASCYMRGIDFYNIPTSLLSMVDSSVGGKTAVNFKGVKNVIGSFYQPKKVIIDINTLKTLEKRHINAGMAEVIKMAACLDKKFFEYLEAVDMEANLKSIIKKAIALKIKVVEEDEKEKNLRKVLNFGHTIGHGIEGTTGLIHGECVALGMMYAANDKPLKRIEKLLKKVGLATEYPFDKEAALKLIKHDKKSKNNSISFVWLNDIGDFEFKSLTLDEIKGMLK